MTRPSFPLVFAVALAAASCSDSTAPAPGTLRPDEVRLKSGLAIAVMAAPSAVAAGDSVTVRVTVRNPTAATVRVESSCTALAGVGVSTVAPPSTGDLETAFSTGCGQAITAFTIAAGDSVFYSVRARTTSLTTSTPLPAGTYYVNAYSHVGSDVLIGPADGQAANVSTPLVLR